MTALRPFVPDFFLSSMALYASLHRWNRFEEIDMRFNNRIVGKILPDQFFHYFVVDFQSIHNFPAYIKTSKYDDFKLASIIFWRYYFLLENVWCLEGSIDNDLGCMSVKAFINHDSYMDMIDFIVSRSGSEIPRLGDVQLALGSAEAPKQVQNRI